MADRERVLPAHEGARASGHNDPCPGGTLPATVHLPMHERAVATTAATGAVVGEGDRQGFSAPVAGREGPLRLAGGVGPAQRAGPLRGLSGAGAPMRMMTPDRVPMVPWAHRRLDGGH